VRIRLAVVVAVADVLGVCVRLVVIAVRFGGAAGGVVFCCRRRRRTAAAQEG